MATVDIDIVYTIEVPELDEVKNDDELDDILADIRENWPYYIDREGYEAYCSQVTDY